MADLFDWTAPLRRPTRRAALSGGLGALTAMIAPAAAGAAPLIRRGGRLFIAAKVNGAPVEALLDSAAEMTLVDPRAAARLGLSLGAQDRARGSGAADVEARMIEHVRLEAAGVHVDDATVAAVDLSDVSRRLLGRPVEVVLGREIFDAAPLLVDIRARRIRRLRPGERPAGVALPLGEQHGLKTLPVNLEGGRPVQAEFDLGNGSAVLVGRRYALAAGLLAGRSSGSRAAASAARGCATGSRSRA